MIAAQNNLYDLETQFIRLVGKPARELVDPVFDLALLPPSREVAVQQAFKILKRRVKRSSVRKVAITQRSNWSCKPTKTRTSVVRKGVMKMRASC